MKKIIALALALLLVSAMAVTVFAEYPEADATLGDDAQQSWSDTEESNYGLGDEDADDTDSSSGMAEVKYGVDQTYIVTIPAVIVFEDPEADTGATAYFDTQLVKADKVKLAGTEKLTVSVTTTNDLSANPVSESDANKQWQLIDLHGRSMNVDYYVTKQESSDANPVSMAAKADNIVLTVLRPNGNAGTTPVKSQSTLCFYTNGTAQEGNYYDQLTFTVDIVDTFGSADVIDASSNNANQTLDN